MHRENNYKEHRVKHQTSLTLQWGFLHQYLVLGKMQSNTSLNSCSLPSLFSLQTGYEAAVPVLRTPWSISPADQGLTAVVEVVKVAKEREHMARCREECCTKSAWHLVGDRMIMGTCWHCVTSFWSLRACLVPCNWAEGKTKMQVLPVNVSHNNGNSWFWTRVSYLATP